MFLSISAASISICRMDAWAHHPGLFSVTRSLKRTPRAMRQSHSAMAAFAAFVPWVPTMPRYRSPVPLYTPLPISVSHTGESIFSASAATSSSAPEITQPPPTKRTGRFAFLRIERNAFAVAVRTAPAAVLAANPAVFAPALHMDASSRPSAESTRPSRFVSSRFAAS